MEKEEGVLFVEKDFHISEEWWLDEDLLLVYYYIYIKVLSRKGDMNKGLYIVIYYQFVIKRQENVFFFSLFLLDFGGHRK